MGPSSSVTDVLTNRGHLDMDTYIGGGPCQYRGHCLKPKRQACNRPSLAASEEASPADTPMSGHPGPGHSFPQSSPGKQGAKSLGLRMTGVAAGQRWGSRGHQGQSWGQRRQSVRGGQGGRSEQAGGAPPLISGETAPPPRAPGTSPP